MKQQKAHVGRQQQVKGQHGNINDVEFDDEGEFLTEEQKRAKRLADLKRKHTLKSEMDPFKKKVVPKKNPAQTAGGKAKDLSVDTFKEDEEEYD